MSFYFDLRNNVISTMSNLYGQSQYKKNTNRLTRQTSKVSKQFDLLCNTWKNCEIAFIDV